MRKAIFFDIDGTLIDAKKGLLMPTKKVRDALDKLKKAGHYVFIATGRPYGFMEKRFFDIGFDGFIMANGTLIFLDGKVFFRDDLNNADAKKICEYAESEKIEYMLQGYPDIYIPLRFEKCTEFINKVGVDMNRIVREFNFDEVTFQKMEFITSRTDFEEVDKVYKKIIATPGFTGRSDPFHFKSLEISSDKISKASGMLKLLNHFGIDVKNSYAFGDGLNDIEMLKTAGTGITLENGVDKAKSAAKFVVPSVHDDGVAIGIEKYIL